MGRATSPQSRQGERTRNTPKAPVQSRPREPPGPAPLVTCPRRRSSGGPPAPSHHLPAQPGRRKAQSQEIFYFFKKCAGPARFINRLAAGRKPRGHGAGRSELPATELPALPCPALPSPACPGPSRPGLLMAMSSLLPSFPPQPHSLCQAACPTAQGTSPCPGPPGPTTVQAGGEHGRLPCGDAFSCGYPSPRV